MQNNSNSISLRLSKIDFFLNKLPKLSKIQFLWIGYLKCNIVFIITAKDALLRVLTT